MIIKYTLGKNERLKRRKLIEALFDSGRSFVLSPFRVYYSVTPLPSAFPAQAGFSVVSKNFKKAVDRNRIRRITKEAYRLQKNSLYDALKKKGIQMSIFFIYTGRELPDYSMVKEKLSLILNKLISIINETGSPNI